MLAKAVKSSGGVLRGGLLRAGGAVASLHGDEETPVHTLFNVTHVPTLLIWIPGSGPRSERTALAFPAQMTSGLLNQGAKALFDGAFFF